MAAAAAAKDGVAAVMMPDFLDIDDIDDVVRDRDLDFDFGDVAAADEFRDAYAAFLANADANGKIVGAGGTGGWIAGPCGGGEGSSEGSTGSSAVTDDGGALLAGDEDVSAFVAELERFLMEDGGDDGQVQTTEEDALFCLDDYFFGDLLATTSGGFDGVAATAALPRNGEVEEEDNAVVDVLAAREDEQASRKRARHKIKVTAVTPWRGGLEVSMRHLSLGSNPSAGALAASCCGCAAA